MPMDSSIFMILIHQHKSVNNWESHGQGCHGRVHSSANSLGTPSRLPPLKLKKQSRCRHVLSSCRRRTSTWTGSSPSISGSSPSWLQCLFGLFHRRSVRSGRFESVWQDYLGRVITHGWPLHGLTWLGKSYLFAIISSPNPLASDHQGYQVFLWLMLSYQMAPLNNDKSYIDLGPETDLHWLDFNFIFGKSQKASWETFLWSSNASHDDSATCAHRFAKNPLLSLSCFHELQ